MNFTSPLVLYNFRHKSTKYRIFLSIKVEALPMQNRNAFLLTSLRWLSHEAVTILLRFSTMYACEHVFLHTCITSKHQTGSVGAWYATLFKYSPCKFDWIPYETMSLLCYISPAYHIKWIHFTLASSSTLYSFPSISPPPPLPLHRGWGHPSFAPVH